MEPILKSLFILFLIPLSSFGNSKLEEKEILINGTKRFFLLHRPAHFTKKSPAVFLLHGGTQSMHKVLEGSGGGQRWKELSDLHGFLLVVPNASNQDGEARGKKQTWNDCRAIKKDSKAYSAADDVAFLKELKASLVKTDGLSPDDFYLTGLSNGGMMALRIAIEAPELFRSYGVIIASLPVKSECIAPTKAVPLFMLNGTEDPLILWKGGSGGRPGHQEELIAPEKVRDLWITLNGIEPSKTETTVLPDIDLKDGKSRTSSRIVKSKYHGKFPLEFYKVDGGGHSLPSKRHQIPWLLERSLLGFQNHDIEGADEIWAFFLRSLLF